MALAGRLRHVVEWFDREGESQGSTRAHVRGVSAREAEIAGLDVGLVGVSIRLRSHPTVRPGPGWRAQHGDESYAVQGSFDPTGKGRELIAVAVESR